MAQVLPKQNTLDYYKKNLKTTILIESDGQLDITNKAQFNQVVMCLKGLAKKLKNHGKGDTQHHEEIDQESLKKIYNTLYHKNDRDVLTRFAMFLQI